jgi:hypothetical protein
MIHSFDSTRDSPGDNGVVNVGGIPAPARLRTIEKEIITKHEEENRTNSMSFKPEKRKAGNGIYFSYEFSSASNEPVNRRETKQRDIPTVDDDYFSSKILNPFDHHRGQVDILCSFDWLDARDRSAR